LGGFLAAKNYELLFWVDGVTNLAAAALLFLLIPATHTQPEAVKHTPGIEQPTGSAYTDKPFIWFSVFIALFAICFFQSFSTLPVFYKEEWQLNEVTIGYIMALNGLVITFVEMPFVKYAEGRMPALYFVAIGTVVVAFSYMVLNLLPGSVMAALVSIMLFTVGEIIAMPFMNTYWTSRSNAANRGQYAALYTAAFSIAHVTGPYTGSQLAHHQGFAVLWWATGALCLLTALGFRFVHHKTDRP
ncbi:MAG: MFS transporter, partial [Dinghuibacter sp.]|nr:MFS transporter [Dinghuibacter sp.]